MKIKPGTYVTTKGYSQRIGIVTAVSNITGNDVWVVWDIAPFYDDKDKQRTFPIIALRQPKDMLQVICGP